MPRSAKGSGRADRPDVVPGVAELRQLGFDPVGEYTGALLVAEMWPDDHRRFVPETRQRWLEEEPQLGGRLWMLRSPWLGWTLHETFAAMWRWLERPDDEYDADYVLAGVADFYGGTRARRASGVGLVTPSYNRFPTRRTHYAFLR